MWQLETRKEKPAKEDAKQKEEEKQCESDLPGDEEISPMCNGLKSTHNTAFMVRVRVTRGDAESHWVAVGRGATIGDLRRAIWRRTGVPWMKNGGAWCGGKCQVLMLLGAPMPTDDGASVMGRGVAAGDVVQLVEDKTAMKTGCVLRD